MNDEYLRLQINELINGTITETGHRELQDRLKADSSARAQLRERLDLEAGLRTWSTDGDGDSLSRPTIVDSDKSLRHWWPQVGTALAALAATILLLVTWWARTPNGDQPGLATRDGVSLTKDSEPTAFIGQVVQQAESEWQLSEALDAGNFSKGIVELVSGTAEFRFNSGTNVLLEGPCKLAILSSDSARLLAGTVFVNVTEVSNGFLLETPDARIVDEGTQYAVALDSTSTEIHVFDGSVIWTSAHTGSDFEDRITSGEARRYLRDEPGKLHHVPFGQRQFVRRIEAEVREQGGSELIAYDGFENLAGGLRRGRSGFGWAAGWESTGRGRGQLAEVVDAPNDTVFGFDRTGRRLLLLEGNDSLRRNLETPISTGQDEPVFVGLLLNKIRSVESAESSLQIVLEPESDSPRFTRRHSVSFGLNAAGNPFINNAGTIQEIATSLKPGETWLFVFRFAASKGIGEASLRIYTADELIDSEPPQVWTVNCNGTIVPSSLSSIRLTVSGTGTWQVDELRIGKSWRSLFGRLDDHDAEKQAAQELR